MFNRSRLLVPFLLIFSCAFPGTPVRAEGPFRFPEGKHGKGELKYINGLPVLTVEGTPEEIGEQVAILVAKPSKRVLKFPREALTHLAGPAGAKTLWPLFVNQGTKLLANFPPAHRKELEAMIKASGLDRESLVIANTMFDLKHYLDALFGCSALVVEGERSQTGKPIFGRNMDYLGLGYLHEYSLVTIYRPKGKHAFAAIGYPSMVGIVSGINDAGLTVTALETTGAPKEEGPVFSDKGTPFLQCYRRLLEECTTIGEAEKLLRSMKRTTTNNLTVCDKKNSAVFEFTPTRVCVRRAEKGMTTCTNHFCTKELRLTKPKDDHKTLERMAIVSKARTEDKKLGVADVQKYLHAANQGAFTIQTMIFEPASLTVHLAIGTKKEPASGQKLKRLDLAPLFGRK
jgi:predicted choloylglycine hydrolase